MDKAPFVTPYIRMEIKDDILYFTYLSGGNITLEVAKDIIKQRLEYTGKVPYPLLVTYEGLRSMDKSSRDYFAKDGTIGVLAAALVTNSVYAEFFGNMFLRITHTTIPSKLFTDRQAALNWLEQFKSKQ